MTDRNSLTFANWEKYLLWLRYHGPGIHMLILVQSMPPRELSSSRTHRTERGVPRNRRLLHRQWQRENNTAPPSSQAQSSTSLDPQQFHKQGKYIH